MKSICLINEQKATMIVEHITYDKIEGSYDSSIFTEEKNKDFARAFRAKKSIQEYFLPMDMRKMERAMRGCSHRIFT